MSSENSAPAAGFFDLAHSSRTNDPQVDIFFSLIKDVRTTSLQMMASSSSSSVAAGVWLFLVLSSIVLAPASVTSEEDPRPIDRTLPLPEVTFTNPKSSLIQLAWIFRSPEDLRRVTGVEVFARDPDLKTFTCENDNFNDGICTISGLSAKTTYNVTVRACANNGCGYPAVVYITTMSEPRIYFGSIFVIFISIVIMTFAVLNYDVFVEIARPCLKKIKRRRSGSRYRVEPSEPDAHLDRQGPSVTTTDVPLTLMKCSQSDENDDMDEISPAIRESPENPENDYYRENEMDRSLSNGAHGSAAMGYDARCVPEPPGDH